MGGEFGEEGSCDGGCVDRGGGGGGELGAEAEGGENGEGE